MAELLKKLLLGKKYIGIEFFSDSQDEKIAFLEVEKKKDSLSISNELIVNGRKELLNNKSNLPAVLTINNAQVLQKEVSGNDSNDKKILHKAYPNIQLDDFYYEIWRNGSISVISICRKNYVEELLAALSQSFKVSAVSLGISPLSGIKNFTTATSLTTTMQTVVLDGTEAMIQPKTGTGLMDINGLQISNQHLLSFSAVLGLIMPSATTGSIHDLNKLQAENFWQDSFFQKSLKAGIALLLCVLLVNFFFFSYYFDKVSAGEESVALNISGFKSIAKIKERIKNKERVMNGFANGTDAKSSLLLNEIIKNIPSTLLLSEIDYHPLDKKIKKEEVILTQDQLISVSGVTMSNEDFTGWVERIGQLPQIKNVTIAGFGKNQEGKTIFTLTITVR